MPATSSGPTPERLMQFVYRFAPPMIIETGLRLQLFDRLEDRVMSIRRAHSHDQATRRLETELQNGCPDQGGSNRRPSR